MLRRGDRMETTTERGYRQGLLGKYKPKPHPDFLGLQTLVELEVEYYKYWVVGFYARNSVFNKDRWV